MKDRVQKVKFRLLRERKEILENMCDIYTINDTYEYNSYKNRLRECEDKLGLISEIEGKWGSEIDEILKILSIGGKIGYTLNKHWVIFASYFHWYDMIIRNKNIFNLLIKIASALKENHWYNYST